MELMKMMRTNFFCARCWLPLLFVICFFSATSQSNADPFLGEQSEWKGFARYDFEFEGI